MKTKLLIVSAFVLLLTACIKDYHGGGQEEEIIFTEKNYIYEGDLYRLALETDIEALDVTIQELEDIIANNQGDENTGQQLEEANEQRSFLTEELQSILSLEQVGLRIPPPPPPCPKPRSCDFSQIQYILTDRSVRQLEIRLLGKDGKLIGGGTINDLESLPGSENQINFSNLMISNDTGAVFSIEVTAIKSDQTELKYTVN